MADAGPGPLTPVESPWCEALRPCSPTVLSGCSPRMCHCPHVVSGGILLAKTSAPHSLCGQAGTPQTLSELGGFLSLWPTRAKGKPWVLQGREESWRKPQGQEGTGCRTQEPAFWEGARRAASLLVSSQ